jgi:hypothetical protein
MKRMSTAYFSLLLFLISAWSEASLLSYSKYLYRGHVFARAEVTTADGEPIWAEYNEQGGHSRLHQLDGQQGEVIAGTQLRAYQEGFQQFSQRLQGRIDILSLESFQQTPLLTADGRNIDGWPAFPSDALTLVLPNQSQRYSSKATELEYYILPIAESALYAQVSDDIRSVLLDQQGEVVYQSPQRIGPLTAFYVQSGEEAPEDSSEYAPAYSLLNLDQQGYRALAPIANVKIDILDGYLNPETYSGADGSYQLFSKMPPGCGMNGFNQMIDAYAHLSYANFHPRGAPAIPYWIKQTGVNLCAGLGDVIGIIGGTSAVFSGSNFVNGRPTIGNVQAVNVNHLNFPVAVNVLTGKAHMLGVEVADQTKYVAKPSEQEPCSIPKDYDGDGEIDAVQLGLVDADTGLFQPDEDGKRYGVFFSGSPRSDGQPNLLRIADTAPGAKHQGLLKTISKEDFLDTDLLVFRESTGELITERNGLSEREFPISSDLTIDQQQGTFNYHFAVRSFEDMHSYKARSFDGFVDWQAKNKMSPSLQAYEADFIRTGERIRIVMINRATGYIGSAITQLTPTYAGGDISVYVPPILMGPPNLKVWTTRRFGREGLLANSDDVRRTISNEGAATTDDTVIEVHTEWLDASGYPLPAGLKGRGYTGRVTRQVANDGDVFDSGVKEFAIDPGRQLQKLDFDNNQAYHHYVQVNAQPEGEQNDFSTGDHTGVLRHRPSRYVPVKVPLYDEFGTEWELAEVRKSNRENDPDDEDIDLNDVPSRHYWVHRPELSFSVIDLTMNEILTGSGDDNNGERINILDDKIPVINSADDIVELIFNLTTSQFDRITPIEGERQYVLSLAGEEILVDVETGGGDQTITFDNLDHLGSLQPEDFLTLSLYLNNDSRNVLWEWGYEYLALLSREDNELQTDDVYYVSADDPEVPFIAFLSGYGERDEELKEPRTLTWHTDKGRFERQQEVNSDTGVFHNELTLPTLAGTRANVAVSVADSSGRTEFKTLEVIPGEAASVRILNASPAIGVMGSLEQTIQVQVSDAHGNLVADGTTVDFAVRGYARILQDNAVTQGGIASVTVTGAERQDDSIVLTARSGNAKQTFALESQPLQLSMTIPSVLAGGSTTTATVKVTNPGGSVDDLPVTLSAPNLGLMHSEVRTNSQGVAQVTLQVPDYALDTYIHARVGYAGEVRTLVEVKPTRVNQHLSADNYQPLLAEKTTDGSYGFNRFDGESIDVGYRASKQVNVSVEPGQTAQVQLGDAYYPNRMPKFSLAMDRQTAAYAGIVGSGFFSGDGSAFADDTGKTALALDVDASQLPPGSRGIAISRRSALGTGSSLNFEPQASIVSVSSEQFDATAPSWAFNVRLEGAGRVIALSDAQSIEYTGTHLVYRVQTTDGFFEVEKAVQAQQWHQVAARINGDQLELFVDDFNQPERTPILGSYIDNHSQLVIGGGFSGQLQALRYYDQSSQPMLELANAEGEVLGSDQLTQSQAVTVRSLGNMNADDEQLGLTYVHLVANGERIHIPLMSEQAYKQIAEIKLNSAQVGPPLAAYSGAPYRHRDPWEPMPLSSFMAQAHAWSLFDVVDLFIPVSSIQSVIEQINLIGTESFDPVTLLVCSIDIILAFAGPAGKVVSKPLKAIHRWTQNPAFQKVVRVLGPFIGNTMGRVIDRRSMEPIVDLLPFLLIVGEIMMDDDAMEVISIMIDAISSSDDLQAWFDYFRLPVGGWEGEGLPDLELDLAANSSALPLSGVMAQAYASNKALKKNRQSGDDAIDAVTEVKKRFNINDQEATEVGQAITRAFGNIADAARTAPPNARRILTDRSTLFAGVRLAYQGSARMLRQILDFKNSRTPVYLQLAAIAYLEGRMAADCSGNGCIENTIDPVAKKKTGLHKKIRGLYGKALGAIAILGYDSPVAAGYQYQLAMLALLNAWGDYGSPFGKVVNIEVTRRIKLQRYLSANQTDEVEPFSNNDSDFIRYIDILTQKDGEEKQTFIELKSYKGRDGVDKDNKPKLIPDAKIEERFAQWNVLGKKKVKKEVKPGEEDEKGKSASPHKQYLLDKIMATDNALILEDDLRKPAHQAESIHWFFQDFKLKTVGGYTNDQIEVVQAQLARNVADKPRLISASLGLEKYNKAAQNQRARREIGVFNLRTVFGAMGDDLLNEIFDLNRLSAEKQQRLRQNIDELILNATEG